MKRTIIILFLLTVALSSVNAQIGHDPRLSVYQYSVSVGSAKAYLWIPPKAHHIKAVMMAMNNLTERRWLEDKIIRKVAAKLGIGIIWIGPPQPQKTNSQITELKADMSGDSKKLLLNMLDDFATVSGYTELKKAYLIPTGHSAHGHFAWNVAMVLPTQTLAAIAIKTIPLPEQLGFKDIPLLYMLGQTTEWPEFKDGRQGDRDFYPPIVRASAKKLREKNNRHLISIVVEPGGGHFDWSPKLAHFMALYLKRAFKYRLSTAKHIEEDNITALKVIAPQEGWVLKVDSISGDTKIMPYTAYKADKAPVNWFFDKRTAKAAKKLNGNEKKLKYKQMPTVIQAGKALNVTKLGYADAKYISAGRENVFNLVPGFLDTVPPELVGAGTPLGNSGQPVKFTVITGPAQQIGKESFQVHFDRAGFGDIWIEASVKGTKQFRHAVQPIKIRIADRQTKGHTQTINFPPLLDQLSSAKKLKLNAVASSGLPVQYTVLSGPAYIKGGDLIFTRIPTKSQFPVKVTVRAFQWGQEKEPFIQSAIPRTRSFLIKEPLKGR